MWETCQGSKWIDIDYRDDQGSTPLICASCFGHSHIAELLLNNGANVDSQDNSGWTALMWATSSHNEELVRVLLEHGASSSAKTARGHTAINIASSNLSSGSDTESVSRVSGSPSTSEAGMAAGTPSRFDDQASGLSDSGSIKASGAGDSDSFVVGSPRSTDQSSVGTPGKRNNGRSSASAGQSVLSMLQASSAKSSRQTSAENADPNSESLSDTSARASRVRSTSKSPLAQAVVTAEDGLQVVLGDETEPNSRAHSSDETDIRNSSSGLEKRLRSLTMDKSESSDIFTAADNASENGNDVLDSAEHQPFDWDTLQLDQMYVISPATVPQFLHATVKDIRPERWLQNNSVPEYKFIPASMIFLAARFAHHLGTPDFLDSFLAEAIASIIHEVQSHKHDPVSLAFWISNIQTLIYFLKRDSTLVQITSDAQGRMSECMQDAYALLVKAVEFEIEPLIDPSLLAYDSMPELFADVKFEAEKSQRLSMFFFGGQADNTRKSSDGRPLRRSQTLLSQNKDGRGRRSSLIPATKTSPSGGPATASGSVPAWVSCVEHLKGSASSFKHSTGASITKRTSSCDTYVSGRSSHDNGLSSNGSASVFSTPSPRTVCYILDCLLDLLEICEIHPFVIWGVMRQMFCYLGGEMFNRVLTTRDFCSRSRAMSIRMNLSHISEWVRTNEKRLVPPPVVKHQQQQQQADSEVEGTAVSVETPTEAAFPSTESLLYKAFFDPLVELLELLQCMTHLPDLAEYFETTAKMQNLNILQQETLVANYRYEVQEKRIDGDVVSYLESIAKEIREGQRAEREKQNMERTSRRSTASVFTERRTMDGRPSLFSFDIASSSTRGAGGLVRFSAEPVVNAGLASDISAYSERAASSSSRETSLNIPMSRLSSESAGQSPSISSGMISMQPPANASNSASATGTGTSGRGRAGTRTARRGLLLPIARPGSTANSRPSARALFPGPSSATGPGVGGSSLTSVGSSRLSDSLEPISEASSIMSRQRSHTTIDTVDDGSEDGSSRNSIVLSGRLSGEVFGSAIAQPPNTAPVGRSWTRTNASEAEYSRADDLTASLRGPKGKKCLPENMTELLDSTELLPFAVPTSREWLVWWQSQKSGAASESAAADSRPKQSREWSNETVAYHQNQQQQQQHKGQPTSGLGDAGSLLKTSKTTDAKRRSELAPVVPSEFLNALSQVA
ncbi:hypothetical protein GGF39_003793 [Coemansia sp. RSA 1721]|nr:hypothetical protein GGF39_003793 [Coemansia sp. RSA 1721]